MRLIIEEADIVAVAEVVAGALALEDATAAQVAAALLDADLIEAAAMNDVVEIVLEALAVEEPEEARAAVERIGVVEPEGDWLDDSLG